MKKHSIVGLWILLFCMQTSIAQSIIVRTGVNLSNQRIEDVAIEWPITLPEKPIYNMLAPKIGGNFGVLIEMPGEGSLSFETGVLLNTRGQNVEGYDANKQLIYMTFEQQKLFLDVPLSLKFTSAGESWRFFSSIGGYIGAGIWGWERISRTILDSALRISRNDMTIVQDIVWGDYFGRANHTNRFEYGSIVSAGVEIGSLVVNASYMHAWTSMIGHGGNNSHYVLSLTGGYKIDAATLFGKGGVKQ
jgi:hypothetical protein